ncbi:tetratricopeptide repeat protein, partial [bacterium]|nr:tetratricopeptide repeat protein [bacterium]
MNEVEKNLSGERALDFIRLSFELKSSKLYKEAIEMLYKALSCPDIGDGKCEIMSQIADLYFKLKNIDRAIEQYEKALDINERHEASLLGLSDIYFSLADYDKA